MIGVIKSHVFFASKHVFFAKTQDEVRQMSSVKKFLSCFTMAYFSVFLSLLSVYFSCRKSKFITIIYFVGHTIRQGWRSNYKRPNRTLFNQPTTHSKINLKPPEKSMISIQFGKSKKLGEIKFVENLTRAIPAKIHSNTLAIKLKLKSYFLQTIRTIESTQKIMKIKLSNKHPTNIIVSTEVAPAFINQGNGNP